MYQIRKRKQSNASDSESGDVKLSKRMSRITPSPYGRHLSHTRGFEDSTATPLEPTSHTWKPVTSREAEPTEETQVNRTNLNSAESMSKNTEIEKEMRKLRELTQSMKLSYKTMYPRVMLPTTRPIN